MPEKAIKQSFKGSLRFNHVDPHFARFAMVTEPVVKLGESEVYGRKEFCITPNMFPAGFGLAEYDVSGSFEFVIEIKKKK